MSFDTPTGTRGRRQPGGWAKVLNRFAAKRVARKGRVMGMDALVLTTIGRKTGQERRTPLGWFRSPDGGWLVVAAAAGAAGNPAWYYNLAAHPDDLWVELGGRKVPVTAEQLHDTERDDAWKSITTAAPTFAKYQKSTDRELPVIRLLPIADR